MGATSALAILIVLGEWTGAARALLGGPFYAGALDVATMGLFIVVAARSWRRRSIHLGAVDLLLILYVGIAIAEIFNPNVPGVIVGLEGFRKSAFAIIAFFIVRLAVESDGWSRFYRIVAAGSVPALLVGMWQVIFNPPIAQMIISSSGVSPISFHLGVTTRAFVPTAGPFHLGILAGTAAILGLVLCGSRGWRWLPVALLGAIVLSWSLTRGNAVATVVAAALVLVLAPERWSRPRMLSTVAVSGAGAVLAVLVITGFITVGSVSYPGIVTGDQSGSPAATAAPDLSGVLDPLEDKNLQYRLSYWREDLKAILERPLIGYGTSAAADGFGAEYAAADARNFDPHSLYLKPVLEDGIPGAIVFLVALLAILWSAVRVLRQDRGLGVILVSIGAIAGVAGLTGPMLDAYPFSLLFWATCGWAVTMVARPTEVDEARSVSLPRLA